ncbi:hypothetical protein [Streptomyces buecherae]|uniref:hypothetical protein n=1 Tax=Streptomyces buecherae TaxID=2763006 RepID=UPI003692695B
MASTEDLRKRIIDPTPLYAVAGAADLAAEKLKEAPALFDRLVAEAPGRIAAVRDADPKAVQERVSQQAQQTQAKLSELLSGLDTDIKKLRETAQDLTLQGVGRVAEYAVRARDTYDELAVRGRGAVQTWRGETSDEEEEVDGEADAPGELGTTRDTAPPRTRPTHRIATPPPAAPARPARPARPAAAPATPAPAGGAKGSGTVAGDGAAKGGGTTKANGTAKANGSAAASTDGAASADAPATTKDASTKAASAKDAPTQGTPTKDATAKSAPTQGTPTKDATAKDAPATTKSAGAPEDGGSADGTRPAGQRPAAPKPTPPSANPNPTAGPGANPNGDPTVRKPAPKSAE